MDDDKITSLFQNFEPELSSESLFLAELESKMERVEIIKQHTAALKRRNRIAVIVAAACGFLMGIILTLLFPFANEWMISLNLSFPYIAISNLQLNMQIIEWLAAGLICAFTIIYAYDITLSSLSSKETHR